jgi:hypothetical protein
MDNSTQQSQQQNVDQDLHGKWLESLTPQQVDSLAMSLSKLALSVMQNEPVSSQPLRSQSPKRGTLQPKTQTSMNSKPDSLETLKQSSSQENKDNQHIPAIGNMDEASLEMARSLGFLN